MRSCAILAALAVFAFLTTGCAGWDKPPLPVVQHVDLERYDGRWYEVARYPNWFQRNCPVATADYTLRSDGKVDVLNACYEPPGKSPKKTARGVARVVDRETNSRLKVCFFWPFEGDYWIIGLADDYGWALVGEPSRRYLWILSRTPELNEPTYQAIVARLPALGYDPARLQRTPTEMIRKFCRCGRGARAVGDRE